MRYSAIATVLMLATLVLSMSACSKTQMAEVEDHRDTVYTRGTMPKYSDSLRATQTNDIAYKYQSDVQQYGAEAEVVSVHSTDLAAPTASSAKTQMATSNPVTPVPSASKTNLTPLPTVGGTQFMWPVKGDVIGQYGRQPDGSNQEGIIISANSGTPILASAAGDVAYVGAALPEFGQMVIIRHAGGYMTSYAHAQEIIVGKGQHVQQGDVIGYVGKSGNAPSPRLHFTIRADKKTVDPMPFLVASHH